MNACDRCHYHYRDGLLASGVCVDTRRCDANVATRRRFRLEQQAERQRRRRRVSR